MCVSHVLFAILLLHCPYTAVFRSYVHSLQFNEVATVRRGWNVDPPAVAVVFNGWVTKTGSVLGDDVFAPMWPDTENITSFREQYFPTALNQVTSLAHAMSSPESLCISIAICLPLTHVGGALAYVCVNRPQRMANGGR
jgi:hypothetical protein